MMGALSRWNVLLRNFHFSRKDSIFNRTRDRCFYLDVVREIKICALLHAARNIRIAGTHLASVGLYVTSYFSTCSTWLVLQDTRTDVGFRNITVMFSGTPGMPVTEPANNQYGVAVVIR